MNLTVLLIISLCLSAFTLGINIRNLLHSRRIDKNTTIGDFAEAMGKFKPLS